VISRARGLQGLRQRRAHFARRSYAAPHVQAMLVPDTWHAFLHDRTTRALCNLWITRRVRLTLPLTFRTGLPGARHHQYRCSSQPLQICSSAGQTSPGSEDLFSQASLVCDGVLSSRAACVTHHGQRASHDMAVCFTCHGQSASQRVPLERVTRRRRLRKGRLAFVQAVLGEELREQVRDGDVVHIGEGDVRVALEAGVRQHQHRGLSAVLVDRLDE